MTTQALKHNSGILHKLIEEVQKHTVGRLESFGKFILYFLDVMKHLFKRPYRLHLIVQHMEFIGNQSVFIMTLTGFFTGAVFGLQLGGVFIIFHAENMLGGATGLALTKELAPLIGAFLLTGRAGSAITAEISTMVVNEQVDALEVMAVDPINYLVVPRVWASFFVMPLLCGLFMFVGMIGAIMVAMSIYYVDYGVFWDRILELIAAKDIVSGLRKMFVFSVIISTIHCYFGLHASGGAKGVGNATTVAVVTTLISLLTVDFFITYLEVIWIK